MHTKVPCGMVPERSFKAVYTMTGTILGILLLRSLQAWNMAREHGFLILVAREKPKELSAVDRFVDQSKNKYWGQMVYSSTK